MQVIRDVIAAGDQAKAANWQVGRFTDEEVRHVNACRTRLGVYTLCGASGALLKAHSCCKPVGAAVDVTNSVIMLQVHSTGCARNTRASWRSELLRRMV